MGFEQLMAQLWKIDVVTKIAPEKVPYAGSTERVYKLNDKETYNKDVRGDQSKDNPITGTNKFEWDVPPYTVFERLDEGRNQTPAGIPSFKDYQEKTESEKGGEEMTNTELLECIKANLMQRGIFGFISLHKLLVRQGNTRTRLITKDNLNHCLCKMGVSLTEKNFNKLFKLFDMSNTNEIDFEEFIRTLVGEMNLSRIGFVEKVFYKLDKDHDGFLDIRDIVLGYDPSSHSDVISKKKMPKEIVALFLDSVEAHLSIIVTLFYNE